MMLGKDLTVADTLSRAPTKLNIVNDVEFQMEMEAYVNLVLQQPEFAIGPQLQERQLQDETCQIPNS